MTMSCTFCLVSFRMPWCSFFGHFPQTAWPCRPKYLCFCPLSCICSSASATHHHHHHHLTHAHAHAHVHWKKQPCAAIRKPGRDTSRPHCFFSPSLLFRSAILLAALAVPHTVSRVTRALDHHHYHLRPSHRIRQKRKQRKRGLEYSAPSTCSITLGTHLLACGRFGRRPSYRYLPDSRRARRPTSEPLHT